MMKMMNSLQAGCISTRISQSQKLCKYRVVLNVDLRPLSRVTRGGKTSPCVRTGFTASAAERRMQNSWFAAAGLRTAPTGGTVIIISLQRLE